jgi:hypothetical protein
MQGSPGRPERSMAGSPPRGLQGTAASLHDFRERQAHAQAGESPPSHWEKMIMGTDVSMEALALARIRLRGNLMSVVNLTMSGNIHGARMLMDDATAYLDVIESMLAVIDEGHANGLA